MSRRVLVVRVLVLLAAGLVLAASGIGWMCDLP